MRMTLLLALFALVGGTAEAKGSWVKKAQKAGFDKIQDCKACHASDKLNAKGEPFSELGKWLMQQKAAKKAQDVDLAWLKEYYAKKK